jgi:hypothetical protein
MPAVEWAINELNPSVIIQGGADGADECARIYAGAYSVECITFAADWKKHGKAAGPIRNQKMIDEGKPECVLAFPGGRGTADMVRRAMASGIHVIEVRPEIVKQVMDSVPQDREREFGEY